MPFKYGIATMIRVPQAFVRVRVIVDGNVSVGVAADLLPPKWFTKDPEKPVAEEIGEMMRVIQHASQLSIGASGESAFDIWREIHDKQSEWGANENLPPLLAHFGTSLVERALIEAVCRAAGAPFWQMLAQNRLGVRLAAIHPDLKGSAPSNFLPRTPLERITARHTIGLADPLLDDQISPDSRVTDGLPQSLAASIQAYGLKHFKIKVTGHLDHDLDRIEQIARVVTENAGANFRFSIDGNEQFKSISDFREFWEAIARRKNLKEFLKALLFVEQPLHRDVALNEQVKEMFTGWTDRPPVIIDESDGDLDRLPKALELGYAGTSHKNCKGVFKGLANRCLITWKARQRPEEQFLMSGEDLATIGPVSVLQDLAVMATLGIESVERNGHHYFAGLSMFPADIQEKILKHHPDLYRKSAAGWPTLNVRDGEVHLDSLNRAALGVGFSVDVEQFTPIDQFRAKV